MEAFLAFVVVFYQVLNFRNYWKMIVFWESYVEILFVNTVSFDDQIISLINFYFQCSYDILTL